jgi:ATP-binding cassette subfamily B protein RaxB
MKGGGYRTMQTETTECGLACIATASAILGADLSLTDLRRRFPVSARGSSMRDLIEVAGANNLIARAVRCQLDELGKLELPAILHWGFNHFIVLTGRTKAGAVIFDPAVGRRKLPWSEVSEKFTGVALQVTRAPTFARRAQPSPLKLRALFRLTPSVRNALFQTLLLSLFLQVYVVASPLYMQLAIDDAALKGDLGMLSVLALGFGAFATFNVVAAILRGFALQRVTVLLNWDMTTRIFRHMIRLPLPWFQRRRLADALTRFESIDPVRRLLSDGLVAAVLDGMLTIVTLVMMFVFSPILAAVVLAGFVIYLVVRLSGIPLNMRLGGEALVASIAEQGKRIETLRAVQSIKLMAAESTRESDWANRYAAVIEAQRRVANSSTVFGAIQQLNVALITVAVIYLGAREVIAQQISVGVLFAFMAYKAQFTDRATALFEQFVGWQMLDLYSMRLADIVLTPAEDGEEGAVPGLPPITGAIEVRNLAFQYGPQDKHVFRNVSFSIRPGEFVAITGPSGVGKSTLLKVLCGLYKPTLGEVTLDGLPLSAWGHMRIRGALGAVMQDDELLAGSIAENVAFFDEQIDMDRVWQALTVAAMAQEVMAMPMRAETFVGDLGGALSGGQKQRILLARALYRRPRILMLDEATSHLDVKNESAINDALRKLDITRIVVAHRAETVAAADRVITFGDPDHFPGATPGQRPATPPLPVQAPAKP